SINIDLGQDVAEINITGDVTTVGGLTINTGNADDKINITGTINLGGPLTINTRAGNDILILTGVDSHVAGATNINTGEGADTVTVANVTFGGTVTGLTG